MKKHKWIADVVCTLILGCMATMVIITAVLLYPEIKAPLNTHYNIWSSAMEEIIKFLICLYTISKVKKFTYQILPLVGIGFGLTEQMVRLFCSGCFPLAPFSAHVVMALTMTYFLSKASKKHKFVYYSLALIVPVFLHMMYNIIIITIYS